jgi:tRNA-5-methyluridine54 2-sulfurtransferase
MPAMKCSLCGELAVINMRRHKLRLCAPHFLDWIPKQVLLTVQKYEMFTPRDRVLVAVSGGKDSLALWDILLRLGYQADGLYIHLGIPDNGYSDNSLNHAQAFAATRPDAHLHVVDVAATYGESVPQVGRRRHRAQKMCSVCGLIKRHLMNQLAFDGGYAVIATGHNLDDEAATLFGNALHWETDYLARQSPVMPPTHPKMTRKVKPLARMYERESAAYALVRGIDYIEDECPYSVDAKSILYKKLLNGIEEQSLGVKAQFYLQFLQAKRDALVTFPAADPIHQLRECDRCGQPTSAPGFCAFCRLWSNSP